jgi:hypothetical protein
VPLLCRSNETLLQGLINTITQDGICFGQRFAHSVKTGAGAAKTREEADPAGASAEEAARPSLPALRSFNSATST